MDERMHAIIDIKCASNELRAYGTGSIPFS
jgi:hypothetical protein